jgi:hypothetical protein
VLALSVPAFAADVAKDEGIYIEGVPGTYTDDYGRGNALVASVIQGTFTDVGPYFRAAMDSHGLNTDIIYDPYGTWPAMDDFLAVCVSTADMWWTYDWNADEAVLSAYMAGGGKIMVCGQDYLYTRLQGIYGFPMDWLGVCGATQDLNWDAMTLNYDGTPGGPMDGAHYTGLTPCFASNNFFTDEIVPCATGLAWWTSEQVGFPTEGGSSTPTALFSSIAFGCLPQDYLNDVVCSWLRWLDVSSPAETSTWGSVKDLFR